MIAPQLSHQGIQIFPYRQDFLGFEQKVRRSGFILLYSFVQHILIIMELSLNKRIDDYSIKELLLSTSKRKYYKALKLQANQGEAISYCCQVISKPPAIPSLHEDVKRFFGLECRNTIQYKTFKETQNNYYIIFEQFNQGTLEQILKDDYIGEDVANQYLRQLLNGLAALHQNGICGIDLSPRSIFKSNDDLRIGQINIALTEIEKLNLASDFLEQDIDIEVLSPEVLSGARAAMKSDLYSVSVLYYRMIYKKYPFKGNTKAEILQSIKDQNLDFNNACEASDDAKSFLRQTLVYDHEKRLKWSEVYQHSLLKKLNNLAIDDSVIVSINLNKFLSQETLAQRRFDVIGRQKLYGDLEVNRVANNPQPATSQFFNQQVDEQNLREFQNQMSLNKQIFEEQKLQAFRRQLKYFIYQRNIYSSLAQSLTYIRLTNERYLEIREMEFILLKCIYLFSENVNLQVGNNMRYLLQQMDENLKSQYQYLRGVLEKENDVIKQQFFQNLEIMKKQIQKQINRKQHIDPEFDEIVNDEHQKQLFVKLRKSIKMFNNESSKFQLSKIDPQFMKMVNCQIIFSGIMVVCYLMKWSPVQLLQKDPEQYLEDLKTMTEGQLQLEIEKQFNNFNQTFEKLLQK